MEYNFFFCENHTCKYVYVGQRERRNKIYIKMLTVLSLNDGDVKCLFKIVFAHRHFLTFYSASGSVTMVGGCFEI